MNNYPRIEWGPNLLIGIPSLDLQHQRLFTLVNIFLDSIGMEKAPDLCRQIFPGLMAAFQAHFRDEECQMQEMKYPLLNEHHDSHQKIKNDLKGIAQEIRNERLIDFVPTANFFAYQIPAHVKTEDFKIALFVKDKNFINQNH